MEDGQRREAYTRDGHKACGQGGSTPSVRAGFSGDLDRVVALNDALIGAFDNRFDKDSFGQIVRLWSVKEREARLIKATNGTVHAVGISGDGSLVLTGHDNQVVAVWDFATGRRLSVFMPRIPPGIPLEDMARLHFVAFSPDHQRAFLSATGAGFVWVWSGVKMGQDVQTIVGPKGFIRAVTFVRGSDPLRLRRLVGPRATDRGNAGSEVRTHHALGGSVAGALADP